MSDIIYWKKSEMRFPAQSGKPVAVNDSKYADCCNCTTRPLYSVYLTIDGDQVYWYFWYSTLRAIYDPPTVDYRTWNGKALSKDQYDAATVDYRNAITELRGDPVDYGVAGADYAAVCFNSADRLCVKVDGGKGADGTPYSGYIAVRFANLLNWTGYPHSQGGTGDGVITADARRFDFSGTMVYGGGELGGYIFTLGWSLSDDP